MISIFQVADQTTDLLALLESWHSRMASQTMTLYMDIAEQPFKDIRSALFRVMDAMATQGWAQAQFRDHPTFCEFLLNRSTETTKSGKEGKYTIVRTLVESPTAMEVMGRVYYVKLKEYAKEGPFFLQVQSAVAMDSRDT